MDKITEVLTRGVAEVLPDKKSLSDLMKQRQITLYLGIDPTGSLLTLGHSVVLRKLQQFADLGHKVILLIGNGTVKIGDPTGRDSTRPLLTDQEIEANFQNWKAQASKVLDFNKIEIKRNGDWLDKMTLPDTIKLLTKTTVQQLLERDMFQERLKNNLPIFTHEIIYPMLQGYDSVMMDVDLEIGGTDQTFNMMMGRDLQKVYHNKDKWVLTTPIINGIDGRKMSKSYGNFIALTENPIDMYGKLMKISDEMIIPYFTLLTDTPLSEIEHIEKALHKGENPMIFKKQLAKTITTMYHTEKEANEAEKHFEKTIQQKELPDQIQEVEIKQPGQTTQILDLLLQTGLVDTKSNAKRLIDQQAVTINGQNIQGRHSEIRLKGGEIIKAGKRKYVKIVLK